jgi:hypothetical protein
VSYPECMAAANRVLRAAEKWRDADTVGEFHTACGDLTEAVDDYRATGVQEQPVIPKEAGD